MTAELLEATGERVVPTELVLPQARELALRLEADSIPFARLVECRRRPEGETVVMEVGVEVPQYKVHPIEPTERIAVTFFGAPGLPARIEALRRDFPVVPHLNLHLQEYPRSICLYEERPETISTRATAPRFVRELRGWLGATSRGELHEGDQPLEPVIIGVPDYLVLPPDLLDAKSFDGRLYVTANRSSDDKRLFLLAQGERPEAAVPFVVSVHQAVPEIHGVIRRRPSTLAELADLVMPVRLDLLTDVRARLREWGKDASLHEARVIHVIRFPRVRAEGGEVERTDTWAFMLGQNVREAGKRLDLWEERGGKLGEVLTPDPGRRGEDIGVGVLIPISELDRRMAAWLNGRTPGDGPRIAAVGAGALGSQVVMNLARSGFGIWTLIDPDLLLPHNVARHALPGWCVGYSKVEALAVMANSILAGAPSFAALTADILVPGEREPELRVAMAEADVILDMSASSTVSRALACDLEAEGRRVSLFLTPSGRDLVLLAEDRARHVPLDAVEIQFYRAMVHEAELEGLSTPVGERWRYGQSCRDVTSTLPQDLVALHSATAAWILEGVLAKPAAAIVVWRADDAGNVHRVDVPTAPVVRCTIGKWTVVTDEALLRALSTLRRTKLPNETGGVLLGFFDTKRKLIYISDTVASPPDSQEWPTLYIRGCQGLREQVAALAHKSDGVLEYVGEWHSHPNGASTAASLDDRQVFTWIAQEAEKDGLPPVMLIVGDSERVSCFVEEMGMGEQLLPRGVLHE